MLAILPWGKILAVEFFVILGPLWISLFEDFTAWLRPTGKADEPNKESAQTKSAPGTETKAGTKTGPTMSKEPEIIINTTTRIINRTETTTRVWTGAVKMDAGPSVIIPPWKPEEYMAGLNRRRGQAKEKQMAAAREPPSVVIPLAEEAIPLPVEEPPCVTDRNWLWKIEKGVNRRIKAVLNQMKKGATTEKELRAALRVMIRDQQAARRLSYQETMALVIYEDEPVWPVFGEEEEGDFIF